MWFRNLQVYRLPTPCPLTLEALDEQLGRHPLTPCGQLDMQSRGWLSPRDDDRYVHNVGGQWLLHLGSEQRLLPGAIIAQTVTERATVLAEEQGFRPGRKQLHDLKERVIDELKPKAFVRRQRTAVWIDPQNGWLAVDVANPARAEEVLEHFRRSVDGLKPTLLRVATPPVSAMAGWLASGDAPPPFTIDRDCELRADSEEKQTVRYVRHALDGDDIRQHLAAGKRPSRLALTWADRVSFILTEKLEIKRLQFLDLVKEAAQEMADHAEEADDAEFSLMCGELSRLLPDLTAALGGEVTDTV